MVSRLDSRQCGFIQVMHKSLMTLLASFILFTTAGCLINHYIISTEPNLKCDNYILGTVKDYEHYRMVHMYLAIYSTMLFALITALNSIIYK